MPFLPAAGVTEMSGVRDSKGDKARRREGVTHELVTCSSAKCFAPIYTGLALWSRIAKYFEYLFSETMWDSQRGKIQNFDGRCLLELCKALRQSA